MWEKPIDQICVPGLSERGSHLLLRFINLSDRSLVHPLSWRRFYGFVRYAHAHGARLDATALQAILAETGFSKLDAQRLSFLYEHSRAILRKPTPVFRAGRFWNDK